MRLNKFLAQAGIASRRKSDKLIQMATTEVNGKLCLDPAYDVKESDVVNFDGQKISPVKEKIVVFVLSKAGQIEHSSITPSAKVTRQL